MKEKYYDTKTLTVCKVILLGALCSKREQRECVIK